MLFIQNCSFPYWTILSAVSTIFYTLLCQGVISGVLVTFVVCNVACFVQLCLVVIVSVSGVVSGRSVSRYEYIYS